MFDQQLKSLDEKQHGLDEKSKELADLKTKVLEIKEQQSAKLEAISGLTPDQAKQEMLSQVERMAKEDAAGLMRKIQDEAREQAEDKGREIVGMAMQKYAGEVSAESTGTAVKLPSEELKGRIIGKEGRNIKTFEKILGVEVIIDDTPDEVIISCFSPVRREVARLTLEKLIQDGRIHPARIEEAYDKAKKEVAKSIKEAGEQILYDLGIVGIHPRLVNLIGRLKYRTSYGQNILNHSKEVSILSGLLAAELGADVKIAKMGGLFHDIGKAIDHDVEGTHIDLGHQILSKFGISEAVIDAAESHHENPDEQPSLEAVVVKTADAISGARYGARKDSYENYVQRLEDLEKLTNSFDGVQKSYAIQAGREVRIFVEPDQVDDFGAIKLARDVATKIEAELKYPGEIKVNVIREKRAVEYAR